MGNAGNDLIQGKSQIVWAAEKAPGRRMNRPFAESLLGHQRISGAPTYARQLEVQASRSLVHGRDLTLPPLKVQWLPDSKVQFHGFCAQILRHSLWDLCYYTGLVGLITSLSEDIMNFIGYAMLRMSLPENWNSWCFGDSCICSIQYHNWISKLQDII